MAYLYRHIRLDKNEPFYIGIGSDSNYKRANINKGRNIFWQRIVDKTDYEVEIILDDLTWEEACKKEMEFISLYGRSNTKKGSLCNLTDGGEGQVGVIFSEEQRKKLSEKYKGEKNPFYGKKHSTNIIEKLKKLAQNRSPEVNKKIALANSKNVVPEERKIRISNSTKGEKNHFYGKKHTEETRLKISKKASGRKMSNEHKNIRSLNAPNSLKLYKEIDGVVTQFNSIRDASRKTGINRNQLQKYYTKYGFYTL